MAVQRLLAYVLILTLIAPSAIAKQRQESPETWRAFANKLEAGAFVRVDLKDKKSVKGFIVVIDGDNLRVKPRTRIPVPIRDIPFTDIMSIERQREGWSAGAKVLTGVAIGVGVIIATAFGIALTWD